MAPVFLFCLFFGGPVPIKVDIGDPILDLPLTALENGVETNLKDIFDEGFAFFLSPDCAHCKAGMANFDAVQEEFNTVFVYVGETAAIREFISHHNAGLGNAFVVDKKHLIPHGLVTFPAALTYKSGRNQVAMHGPMTRQNLRRLVMLHNRNFVMQKNPGKH